MNVATAIPIDLTAKNDHDIKQATKSINGNQSKSTATARSFGRELSNFEAQSESTGDNSKGNVQSAANHKENFFVQGRASVSNESGLEKAVNKQTHIKDQDTTKNQQTSYNQSLGEESESEREELCAFDKERQHNPQYLVPYVREIFANLRETEEKYMAQTGYIARVQSDVNEKMRAILVDWLVDVHIKFKLLPETLFLSVNIVDRYLEQTCVPRQRLQLVGVSAMLIASKYEEIYPPEVKEFEYVTDRAYNREDILEMEGNIINALKFNITTPSSLRFLERYGAVSQLDEKMMNMAKYLLELALVDYKMLKYTPSTIACSAVYLINKIHKREGWSDTMVKEGKYLEAQLRPCAKDLCVLLQGAAKSSLQAVRRKFASTKYMQVSKIQLDKV